MGIRIPEPAGVADDQFCATGFENGAVDKGSADGTVGSGPEHGATTTGSAHGAAVDGSEHGTKGITENNPGGATAKVDQTTDGDTVTSSCKASDDVRTRAGKEVSAPAVPMDTSDSDGSMWEPDETNPPPNWGTRHRIPRVPVRVVWPHLVCLDDKWAFTYEGFAVQADRYGGYELFFTTSHPRSTGLLQFRSRAGFDAA